MSHKTPLTFAIKALDAKPFDISLATSKGVVFHFFPSFTFPSGKTILYPNNNNNNNNNNNKELRLITKLIQAKEDFTVRIILDGFCSEGKTLQELLSFYGFEQKDALGNNSLEITFILGCGEGRAGLRIIGCLSHQLWQHKRKEVSEKRFKRQRTAE
jgi:hypothetical protein